jgi:8-oxo-dGTP diphosphatase
MIKGMPPTLIRTMTVPWVRPEHRLDLLLTPELPEGYQVTTAFVVALDGDDRMLLTRVDLPGRGWGVPGGHLEPGESPVLAAARELAEETGLALPAERLSLFGGQQITLLEPAPVGYRYPARAFMAFYTVRLDGPGAPTRPHPDSECGAAEWVDRAEVPERCPAAAWLPLLAALDGPDPAPWRLLRRPRDDQPAGRRLPCPHAVR